MMLDTKTIGCGKETNFGNWWEFEKKRLIGDSDYETGFAEHCGDKHIPAYQFFCSDCQIKLGLKW